MMPESYGMSELLAEANPEEAERQAEQARSDDSRRAEEVKDLRVLLVRPEFRRYIWRLLGRCNVYSLEQGALRRGERSIGLFILAELGEADANAYPNLQLENGGGHQND